MGKEQTNSGNVFWEQSESSILFAKCLLRSSVTRGESEEAPHCGSWDSLFPVSPLHLHSVVLQALFLILQVNMWSLYGPFWFNFSPVIGICSAWTDGLSRFYVLPLIWSVSQYTGTGSRPIATFITIAWWLMENERFHKFPLWQWRYPLVQPWSMFKYGIKIWICAEGFTDEDDSNCLLHCLIQHCHIINCVWCGGVELYSDLSMYSRLER